MLIRLLTIAVLASFACRKIFGRWPWDFLRPPPTRQQAVVRARKLLGLPASAGHAEIIDAHRRLIVIIHPDKGGTNDQVHEANAARDILLDQLSN